MNALGIYEKALPKNVSWEERLLLAKSLGFDFVEMSIDETDDRLARLNWSKEKRQEVRRAISKTEVPIQSICLSGHRRYPLGSIDQTTREKGMEIMAKAIDLAVDLGVRVIQLAGYDVYYEEKSVATRSYFIENLEKAVALAARKQVIVAIEIMDDPFMASISKFKRIQKQISSPWLQVYPDLGNLSAWPENDPGFELELGRDAIVATHLKDTLAVTADFPGKFKEVPFGEGCVDFLGCLKRMKSFSYSGPFLIEMWSEENPNFIEEIEEAKAYLLPLLKEAGFDDE